MAGQALLVVAEPVGHVLFIVISILVSISFAPIPLSIRPTPAFERTTPMSLRQLYMASRLGCVGMLLLGGVFSSQFGMAAIFGSVAELRLAQISSFIAAFYVGAIVLQYLIAWSSFAFLLCTAFLIGGISNPLYSLLVGHTYDFLDYEDMAAASNGLLSINVLGAVCGPLVFGWMMDRVGSSGFFIMISPLLGGLTIYAFFRMTQRASVTVEDIGAYAAVTLSASLFALKIPQDFAVDIAVEETETRAQVTLIIFFCAKSLF